MEEGDRNIIVVVLSLLLVTFFIFSVSSCIINRGQKKDWDKDRLLRMELQEKITDLVKKKADLEKRIEELGRLINEEKAAHETTKRALSQEQLVNKSLKEELAKVLKTKETLEGSLNEARE